MAPYFLKEKSTFYDLALWVGPKVTQNGSDPNQNTYTTKTMHLEVVWAIFKFFFDFGDPIAPLLEAHLAKMSICN